MTYVKTGPFNNAGAPGIQASFLNNVENWIASVDNPTVVQVTGSVSGTASLYQQFTGTNVKKIMCTWTTYKSAAAQLLVLPVPFTWSAQFTVGETQGNTIEFLLAGVAQNLSIMNTIGSGGGTQNPGTAVHSWTFGMTRTGFDTIRLTFTGTVSGGLMLVEGL